MVTGKESAWTDGHAWRRDLFWSRRQAEQRIVTVLDLTKCCGSGACVTACPEKALSLINGKAVLTDPTHCIGHGACIEACPVEALQLVFGTEKRGMDIPFVAPTFETNVANIFIAGELGGMGLIRKAAIQGKHERRCEQSHSDGEIEAGGCRVAAVGEHPKIDDSIGRF